jgi:CRISPR system Cascade subunit CasD
VSIVALRLAGPLQAWGAGSKFTRRSTQAEPTKSGIIGLVAAAKGLRRSDPLTELLGLRLGIRVDQPGQLVRDFQTAIRRKAGRGGNVTEHALPLSYRYYQGDAVFLAVLQGERELVEGLRDALRRPEFPLYLGRRSCPPAGPIVLPETAYGIEHDLDEALHNIPWQASRNHRRAHREHTVRLGTVYDARPGEPGVEMVRDEPVSFDPNRRQYAWRPVLRSTVLVDNPDGHAEPRPEHDPMPLLGGQ